MKAVAVCLVILILLTGCAGQSASAEDTLVPPTEIPTEPPTATQVPPVPTSELTPPSESPKKIQFIGNSVLYTNDGVEHHMAELAGLANPPLTVEVDSSTMGGASLERLWNSAKSLEWIQNCEYDR